MADVVPTEEAGARHERSALLESAVAAAVLGTAAVVAGLVSGSAVVLSDGLYTLAGIALVGVSALASRAAASRPGGRYPFGRHAATPLAVVVQGAALVGRRLYVEVGFVVEPGRWGVDDEDDVRRAVVGRLRDLPLDVWATVELTADPGLAA